MNLVLALILAVIILLCMFLIPNKLIAVVVVLIVTITLILARPGDFTLNHSYIVTQPKEEECEGSLATGSNVAGNNGAVNNAAGNAAGNTAGNAAANAAAAAAAAMGFESNSVEASNNMNSVFATIGDVVDGLDLSENNVDKIGDTLENIDWGNILIKSLGNLQKYSENNGVSGTNNSKLNNNAVSVENGSAGIQSGSVGIQSGSPGIQSGSVGIQSGSVGIQSGSAGIQSGSPGIQSGSVGIQSGSAGIQSGSPAGIQSGSVGIQSGSPGSGSPEYSAQEDKYISSSDRLYNLSGDIPSCNGTCGHSNCSSIPSVDEAIECGTAQCNARDECQAFVVKTNSDGNSSVELYETQDTVPYSGNDTHIAYLKGSTAVRGNSNSNSDFVGNGYLANSGDGSPNGYAAVSGNSNSKLNNNAASVENGSPAGIESGSPEPEPSWPSILTIESITSTSGKPSYDSYTGTYNQVDNSEIQLPEDDTVSVVQAWTRDYDLTSDTVYLITLRADGTLTIGYWRDTSGLTTMTSTITVSNFFESGVTIPLKRNGFSFMYDVIFSG
jgi:hypothetical protein